MKLTEKEVRYVADLANLSFSDDEVRKFARELDGILEHMDKLNELDTSSVEPALGGLTPEGAATDSARNDELAGSLGQKTALAEAPDPAEGHFRVPKVL